MPRRKRRGLTRRKRTQRLSESLHLAGFLLVVCLIVIIIGTVAMSAH